MRFTKIRSIRKIGKQPCLDLEVKHKDHNFYAEGLVVSNSHSCAYGYILALTALLKYRYPLYFYAALLNFPKKKNGKIQPYIQEVIQEISSLGFKLYPPDISKKQYDFDVDEENQCIRFGLTKVKSITPNTIPLLDNFIGINYKTRMEAFCAAKNNKINITILSSLIRSGCFDNFSKNRSLMVLEAKTLYKFTEKELLWATRKADGVTSLPDLINLLKTCLDDKQKKVLTDKRLETIREVHRKFKEDYELDRENPKLLDWRWEKNLLGYSHSKSLKELFTNDFPNLSSLKEILEGENREYSFVAFVQDVEERTSAAGNEYFGAFAVDEAGSIKIGAFNDAYKMVKKIDPKLKDGDIVLVNGTKKDTIFFIKSLIIKDRNSKVVVELEPPIVEDDDEEETN